MKELTKLKKELKRYENVLIALDDGRLKLAKDLEELTRKKVVELKISIKKMEGL